ncbi:MAG: lactonase family protein [Prevotellaceae bacterium]|jgi:6-phosphogluconolactonase|nr:lactonase family protein [Prevotellaceae bacterium]
MKNFFSLVLYTAAVSVLAGVLPGCTDTSGGCYKMIAGTYTGNTAGEGIYVYEVNAETGDARQLFVAGNIINPSYVALSPDKKYLYAVNEFGGRSAVSGFSFDRRTGALQLLNAVSTPDADPCYISVTDKHVITAGYTSGSISVFGRLGDGSLSPVRQVIFHTGKSIDTVRQQTPHLHQAIFTPDGRHLLACDLGTDKITAYRYCATDATRILTAADSITVKKGSGPRHLAFNARGDRAYLLQELDGTVTVLSVDTDAGLAILQETTVSMDSDTGNGAAAIHLSPDGRFVYATNRGTVDNITCFAIRENGQLEWVEQLPAGGKGPRDFTITPDGRYLFIANQRSGNITIFKRNQHTGKLMPTGKEIACPAPVCLVVY